jgi:hypothetical protein
MAVVIGDCVHFFMEYGGKTQKCRVSDIALLNKERVRKKDTSHEELIAIFEKQRAEIERIAVAKLQSGYVSLLGIILTTEDLNP